MCVCSPRMGDYRGAWRPSTHLRNEGVTAVSSPDLIPVLYNFYNVQEDIIRTDLTVGGPSSSTFVIFGHLDTQRQLKGNRTD